MSMKFTYTCFYFYFYSFENLVISKGIFRMLECLKSYYKRDHCYWGGTVSCLHNITSYLYKDFSSDSLFFTSLGLKMVGQVIENILVRLVDILIINNQCHGSNQREV